MKTSDERFNLRGKVAAVIGGAGYLCSTLAQVLSDSGMEVVVLDITERPQSGGYLRCDVTSKDDHLRCRDEILKRHGRVDVLLNGADTNAPTPFFDILAEESHSEVYDENGDPLRRSRH